MRVWISIISALFLVDSVRAQPALPATQPAPQVAAAMDSAVGRLQSDIEAEPITNSISVRTFLDKTDSRPRLRAVLEQAQQIGGPRWLDNQTCQVRFDISADTVREELKKIAVEHAAATPISADELLRVLKSWDGRVFSATGASTQGIDSIRPPADLPAWRDLNDTEIRQSVIAARQDAVNRVLASVQPISLAANKNIGDCLAIAPIGASISNWISDRPITLVDFRDDQRVQITLAVSPAELSDELRTELAANKKTAATSAATDWAGVQTNIAKSMADPIGQSGPAWPIARATRPVGVSLSEQPQPPAWVGSQLDEQGSGAGRTQLLAARAAQIAAVANLRGQVMRLPLSDNKAADTLADLAAHNARMAAAIDRTLSRDSRVYSVDYLADGSVNMRVSLDSRILWQNLLLAQ